MRTRLALLAVLALAALSLAPADARAQLGTSTWSMEIGTDIGTSDDFSFALRKHTSATSAWRLGLEVELNRDDAEGEVMETGVPDTDAERVSDFHEVALAIHWMRFASIRDDVSATFATGPFVRSFRNSDRQEFDQGLPTFDGFEFRNDETTFGWDLLFGAEWFFSRRLSLGASTGFRGEIGSGNIIQISRDGTGGTYDKTELQLESDIARFTTRSGRIFLSAYF